MKDMYPLSDVGRLVTDLRTDRNKTRYAFAKDINFNDITIKRIETNEHSASIKQIVKLLRRAGYTPYVVLRRNNENNEQ